MCQRHHSDHVDPISEPTIHMPYSQVHVYERGSNGLYTLQATLDAPNNNYGLGAAITISDDGCILASASQAQTGGAWVWTRGGLGGAWTRDTFLAFPTNWVGGLDRNAGLDISGDGSTIVLGYPGFNTGNGGTYVRVHDIACQGIWRCAVWLVILLLPLR